MRKSLVFLIILKTVFSQDNVWSLYQILDADVTNSSPCVEPVAAFERHTEVTSQIECLGLCSRVERCIRTKYNESALICEFFDSIEVCENNFGNTNYEKVISFIILTLVESMRNFVLESTVLNFMTFSSSFLK